MRFLDGILSRFGYERSKTYRRSGPGFAGAAVNRLTADWTISTLSSDSKLRQDLPRLRARCRVIKDDNNYGQKFVFMSKSNILGENGISFRNKAKDPDTVKGGVLVPGKLDVFANKQIQDAWLEWGKKDNCTVTGQLTWCDVQNLVVETLMTDGECLIRLVRGFDNPFKFALQLLESDHLDIELNKPLGNGNEIRMGVEFNKWKKPVAYHVLVDNPNDNYFTTHGGRKYQRIPAEEMIHPFLPRRIGQSRGYPPMATAMTDMNMIGKYQEAELVASREGACKGGWFKETGELSYNGDEENGQFTDEVEPGTWKKLPRGVEPVPYDPDHPNSNYGNFMKTALRGIAAGLGHISYNSLANDMESVNFASGKLGLDEERQGWRVLQNFFAEHVCDDIFEPWLEMSLLSGAVALPFSKFDKFNKPCWTGRRWSFIDPTKEVGAIVQMINAGLFSRSAFFDQMDIDRDENDQQMEDDNKSAELHGLQFKEIAPEPDPIELEEAKASLRPAPAAK